MEKYDNSGRLEEVGEKDWREALDELTAYLRWRLRGKTRWGAHREKELGILALDYYTEESVAKLIEGCWKWQERYTLGQQLVEIAGNLITKQAKKYKRVYPLVNIDDDDNVNDNDKRKLVLITGHRRENFDDVIIHDDCKVTKVSVFDQNGEEKIVEYVPADILRRLHKNSIRRGTRPEGDSEQETATMSHRNLKHSFGPRVIAL